MGWDKIWDGLDNEKNWEIEKYRAQSTILGVQYFHKHWGPAGYFVSEYLR